MTPQHPADIIPRSGESMGMSDHDVVAGASAPQPRPAVVYLPRGAGKPAGFELPVGASFAWHRRVFTVELHRGPGRWRALRPPRTRRGSSPARSPRERRPAARRSGSHAGSSSRGSPRRADDPHPPGRSSSPLGGLDPLEVRPLEEGWVGGVSSKALPLGRYFAHAGVPPLPWTGFD